jgi:predicted HD phosphohydrolase
VVTNAEVRVTGHGGKTSRPQQYVHVRVHVYAHVHLCVHVPVYIHICAHVCGRCDVREQTGEQTMDLSAHSAGLLFFL